MNSSAKNIDERTKTMLVNDILAATTNREIRQGLFEANNYDHVQSHRTWVLMNSLEHRRDRLYYYYYGFLLSTIFCGYQTARLTSLSPSGRFWAPIGLVLSGLSFFSAAASNSSLKRSMAERKAALKPASSE